MAFFFKGEKLEKKKISRHSESINGGNIFDILVITKGILTSASLLIFRKLGWCMVVFSETGHHFEKRCASN